MGTAKLKGNKFICHIHKVNGFDDLFAIVDTGSPISILNVDHVVTLTGIDFDMLLEYFNNRNKSKSIKPYMSDEILLKPCYLRNIRLFDSIELDTFRFGMSSFTGGAAIIGMDILRSCNFHFDKEQGVLEVYKYNPKDNEQFFSGYFNSIEAEELCSIFEKKSAEDIWDLLKRAEGN